MGVGLKVQLESALNGSETAAGMTLEMADYSPLKLKRSKRDCVTFKVVFRCTRAQLHVCMYLHASLDEEEEEEEEEKGEG